MAVSVEAAEYREMTEQFAKQIASGSLTLDGLRDGGEGVLGLSVAPEGVTYSRIDAGGVPAIKVGLDGGAETQGVLVFFHGGGYVISSAESHKHLAAHMAKRLGVEAVVVDYRRAPENAFPIPVEDAFAAYRWVATVSEWKDVPCVFAGDSAGGGLCITVQTLARQRGVPLPVAAATMSPWCSHDPSAPAEDLSDEAVCMAHFSRLFLGEHGDPADPLAAPSYADLTGLAPLFVQVGGAEMMVEDVRRFANRAKEHGVEVTLEVPSDMMHQWQLSVGRMPEADAAVERACAFLAERLPTTVLA